jgi:probable HAF family extracellular repeat protein
LTPAQTEAAYAATELASLPVGSSHVVRAANDADEIVGSAQRGGGRGHRGFLLESGPLQEIRGLPGSDESAALGINNLGQVVGSANTATGMRAFRSRRTTGIVALGTLPGDSGSVALAINHLGQAVGHSSGPTGVRAVVWTPAGAIQALPMLPGSDSSGRGSARP